MLEAVRTTHLESVPEQAAGKHVHILLLADLETDAQLVSEHLNFASGRNYHFKFGQLAGFPVDAEDLEAYHACAVILRVSGQIPSVLLTGKLQEKLPTIIISAFAEEDFNTDFCELGLMDFLPMLHVSTGTLDSRFRYVVAQFEARKQLEEWAFVDSLTGAATRRLFGFQLEKMAVRAKRCSNALTFCMLDIDDFKAINDEYGHAAGDAVLAECAARIKNTVRASDLVGRFGGDEFSIVLEGADVIRAHDIIGRLQGMFDGGFSFRGTQINVTCSLGGVHFRADTMSVQNAFEAADVELYNAKHQGKNCYSLSTR